MVGGNAMIGHPNPSGRGPWCPYCKEVRLTLVGHPMWGVTRWLCRNCGWESDDKDGGGVYFE